MENLEKKNKQEEYEATIKENLLYEATTLLAENNPEAYRTMLYNLMDAAKNSPEDLEFVDIVLYSNLLRFLDRLETLERFLEIENKEIEEQKNQDTNNTQQEQ